MAAQDRFVSAEVVHALLEAQYSYAAGSNQRRYLCSVQTLQA